jgi:hypothetical protein
MQIKPPILEKGSWIATIVSTILFVISLFFPGANSIVGFFLPIGFLLFTISLIPWNLLFHTKIFRKPKLITGIRRTRQILGSLGVVAIILPYLLSHLDLSKLNIIPTKEPYLITITKTPTLTLTSTHTQTPSNTPSPSASPAFRGQPVIDIVASFYVCINNANIKLDYDTCWNSLPDRDGEFKANVLGGYDGFIDFWKNWKVSVDLYYCDTNLVTAKLQYYFRSDTSKPSNPNHFEFVEYTLAFDDSGWRIKSGRVIPTLSSLCGSKPILTISPNP